MSTVIRGSDRTYFLIWVLYYIYIMFNSIAFEKGSAITIVMHAVIMVYLLYYNFLKNRFWGAFGYIYLYLLFLFVLTVLTSSNLPYSFKMLIKYAEELLFLPVSFCLFSSKEYIDKMWGVMKIMLILFIVNYLIANIFHLGGSLYVEMEGGDTGNIEDEGHYICACICAVLPLAMMKESQNRMMWGISVAFAIALVLSTLKRTSMVCIIVPFLVYAWYRLWFKLKYDGIMHSALSVKKIIVYVLLCIAFFFFVQSFHEIIEKRFEARSERFGNNFEKEGRVLELEYIYNDIVVNGDLQTFLFGKETFNTVRTYANGKFGKRMIHENYGIILNGTGMVGLFIHIGINLYLILLFFRYSKRVDLSENDVARKFYVAFIGLWWIFFIASFSGTIWNPLYSSMHYALTGMILRYFYEYGQTYEDPCCG